MTHFTQLYENKTIIPYAEWLEWDGRIVYIDQHAHRLSCKLRTARYPSPRSYVEVWAEMVDKQSPAYLERKAELGDHWGIDLLNFHCEEGLVRLCDVEQQLLPSKQPAQPVPTII